MGKNAPEAENKLGTAIKNFADNLTALRDFTRLVGSLLDNRQKTFVKQHLAELEIVLAAMHASKILGDEESQLGGMPTPALPSGIRVSTPETGKMSIDFDDPSSGRRVLDVVQGLKSRTQHQSLLYRSALISLVSAAEWFLSQVIRQHFDVAPDAVGIKEKQLSLEDLRAIGSIEDARQLPIDSRIDEIMWGSLEDWLKYLKEKIKLKASYIDPVKDRLVEVFQRRNVMIHNNGVVHSTYIAKVAPAVRQKISAGMHLEISPDYLAGAIDLVEVTFILLGAELWKQLYPEDVERAPLLNRVAFDRLQEQRWSVAEGLCVFVKQDKKAEEVDQMVGLINYWQSLKWQGRFGEIKKEVEKADFSAKDELFQIGRLALLDDFPKFFGVLPRVIKAGKMDREKLTTWPLFTEVRKNESYSEFLRKQKWDQDELQDTSPPEGKRDQPRKRAKTVRRAGQLTPTKTQNL